MRNKVLKSITRKCLLVVDSEYRCYTVWHNLKVLRAAGGNSDIEPCACQLRTTVQQIF